MIEPHPLREWRDKTAMSQEKLAAQAGVVSSHISQIETGDRVPSLSLASRLSQITGIPIEKFVAASSASAA